MVDIRATLNFVIGRVFNLKDYSANCSILGHNICFLVVNYSEFAEKEKGQKFVNARLKKRQSSTNIAKKGETVDGSARKQKY